MTEPHDDQRFSRSSRGEEGPSTIGARLRAARERRGWTREALAYHAGVSWAAIAQIESGRRTDVRQSTLTALSSALGISVDHLLGRSTAAAPVLQHEVMIYRTPTEFRRALAPFLNEGIRRGDGAVVVTSEDKIAALRDDLGAASTEVTFISSRTWYGQPHTTLEAFRETIDEKIAAGHGWVRAIGEPLWLGRSAREVRRWIRYESLINLGLADSRATIVCPYDASSLPQPIVASARRTHPMMYGKRGHNAKYREPIEFLLSDEGLS